MKLIRPPWTLVLSVLTITVTACTAGALTQPIGTRRGSTEYQVSCQEQGACNAEIQKICTAGHFITGTIEGTAAAAELMPPIKQPLTLEFVCTPPSQAIADDTAKQQPIQVLIRPECKFEFYGPKVQSPTSLVLQPTPDYLPWNPAWAIPMSHRDPRTSIAIYVESDGRHLAAIDSQGKLLWVRNPWEEGRFCQYRTPWPVVFSLRRAQMTERAWAILKSRGANLEHTFITLTFDSSQFGEIDELTGNFFGEGQN
jgi:hypothetical protein